MPQPPSFAFFCGPLLLLVCFALIAYGVFIAQVYYYSKHNQRDLSSLKNLVCLLALMESAHTVFCIVLVYDYFISYFGDMGAMDEILWSLVATVYLEITIVAVVQGYFIFRVWAFSGRSFWMAAIPGFALLVRVALGFVAAVFLCLYSSWSGFESKSNVVRPMLNVALSCGVFVDLFTTTMLAYYLYNRRSQFEQTKHIVDRLIHYSLNTGALTMIVSMSILLTYNLLKNSLLWVGLVEIVSKLYANAMLVMLNARPRLRGHGESDAGSIPLNVWSGSRSNEGRTQSDGVRVEVFKESRSDRPTVASKTNEHIPEFSKPYGLTDM